MRDYLLWRLILQDKRVIDVWQFVTSLIRIMLEAHHYKVAELLGYAITEFGHPIWRPINDTFNDLFIGITFERELSMVKGVKYDAHIPKLTCRHDGLII